MIRELLDAHYLRPYPENCRGPVANIDLDMLDADVVGLASQYVEHGALSEHQLPIMQDCLDDANRVLPFLAGDAHVYFAGVRDIAAAVLGEAYREAI